MATSPTQIPGMAKKHFRTRKLFPILLFLGILGVIIAGSTVYISVTTYQSQDALPAYYTEMAGIYHVTKKGQPLSDSTSLNLKENGFYILSLRPWPYSNSWDSIPTAGDWHVNGDFLILTANSIREHDAVLNINGDDLYAPLPELTFTR